MSQPRITALEPGFATGHWHDLFIGVWRGTPTLEAVAEWSRQYDHMAARHPIGFLSIVVIEAHTPIPDGATRKALTAVMDRLGSNVRAMAAVQEASGFVGATVRSVLLLLTNMSTGPYPRRIFGSCQDAARWLALHKNGQAAPMSAEQVVAAVASFRALLKVDNDRARPGMQIAS